MLRCDDKSILRVEQKSNVRLMYVGAGPRRPASSLDVKAANRFVEHAIPDLSKGKQLFQFQLMLLPNKMLLVIFIIKVD